MSTIKKLESKYYPSLLEEIPDKPKQLWYAGNPENLISDEYKLLCIVGSRKYTSYGKDAVESLVYDLKGYPVIIVSGLALGIDSIAHRAALRAGLPTISCPGSGLDKSVLHPHSHVRLAEEIVEAGGTLLSELEPKQPAGIHTFPKRNRIMAGMSHATLVVEAETKSGTLITSRLATEYNREVMAIPGNIFQSTSDGPNMLIRLGATPVRNTEDILESLNINMGAEKKQSKNYVDCSENEMRIIEILKEGSCERDELVRRAELPVSEVQQILTMLELKGYVKESLGELRLI